MVSYNTIDMILTVLTLSRPAVPSIRADLFARGRSRRISSGTAEAVSHRCALEDSEPVQCDSPTRQLEEVGRPGHPLNYRKYVIYSPYLIGYCIFHIYIGIIDLFGKIQAKSADQLLLEVRDHGRRTGFILSA